MRRGPLAVALALGLGLAPPSPAADADAVGRFRQLVERGRAAHDDGDFAVCVGAYREARALHPEPTLRYNEGVCAFDAGWDDAARDALEDYLHLAPDGPEAARARELLRALAPPLPASPTSPAPPASTSPAPPAATATDPPPRVTAEAHPSGDHDLEIAGLATAGTGLALLVAGAVMGGVAEGRWQDALAACPERTRCDDDRGAALSSEARGFADASTALIAVGGAAAAAGIVLWLTAPDAPEGDGAAIQVAPAPAGIRVQGRW